MQTTEVSVFIIVFQLIVLTKQIYKTRIETNKAAIEEDLPLHLNQDYSLM